ncbi:MAG: pyridoxamine 5'-phosphate oxidase family protein [Alphaproteobacteria bacterium]|nr:pyridoxamine 5'-phosphate oxidase family protein [Alphaproteobacteria bacterium]
MYHNGSREIQALFGSTALADRLAERLRRSEFSDEDRDFIHACEYFFLATATPDGHPDCSFKGGPPEFVQVLAPDLLVWPDYDGNGMFKSLGNLKVNPNAGLLFIRMGDSPKRLRVNGHAEVEFNDPLAASFPGAQGIVRLTPVDIFPNCPRYIPDPATGTPSPYVPKMGETPPEPKWKAMDAFRDVVPPRKA